MRKDHKEEVSIFVAMQVEKLSTKNTDSWQADDDIEPLCRPQSGAVWRAKAAKVLSGATWLSSRRQVGTIFGVDL